MPSINAKVKFCLERAAKLSEQYGKPSKIRLATYENELAYAALNTDPEETFETQKKTIAAAKAALEKQGYKVCLRAIKANDYSNYLANNRLEDTPSSKAIFIAGQNEEDKP